MKAKHSSKEMGCQGRRTPLAQRSTGMNRMYRIAGEEADEELQRDERDGRKTRNRITVIFLFSSLMPFIRVHPLFLLSHSSHAHDGRSSCEQSVLTIS